MAQTFKQVLVFVLGEDSHHHQVNVLEVTGKLADIGVLLHGICVQDVRALPDRRQEVVETVAADLEVKHDDGHVCKTNKVRLDARQLPVTTKKEEDFMNKSSVQWHIPGESVDEVICQSI